MEAITKAYQDGPRPFKRCRGDAMKHCEMCFTSTKQVDQHDLGFWICGGCRYKVNAILDFLRVKGVNDLDSKAKPRESVDLSTGEIKTDAQEGGKEQRKAAKV